MIVVVAVQAKKHPNVLGLCFSNGGGEDKWKCVFFGVARLLKECSTITETKLNLLV